MLLTTRTRVIPSKSYHKILNLYPAIDDTFVFLGMKGLRQDCITHMNSKGNVLFQYTFEKPMDSMGMLSQHQAILLQTRGNCITILNLINHKFTRIPHHFFNQQSDQASIHTFADTKLLCVQQFGRYNDNRYKLTYYQYPIDQVNKPINVFQAKDSMWTHQYSTKKANQHSMVVWFKARHDFQWQFKTYNLINDTNKGIYNFYKFPQQIGIPYNMTKVEVGLNTMWQISQNKFMLVCISNKNEDQINKQLGVIQNNYILNVKTGDIRECRASFGWHHDYQIDQVSFGRFSMFRTFNFQYGKSLPSPIFYIDNISQQIIHEQSWQCSYLHKYQFPGWNSNMFIQNIFQNGDCQWFQCVKKEVVVKKQLVLHFLLSIYQHFDDDLLQDVLQTIDWEPNVKDNYKQTKKQDNQSTHSTVKVQNL